MSRDGNAPRSQSPVKSRWGRSHVSFLLEMARPLETPGQRPSDSPFLVGWASGQCPLLCPLMAKVTTGVWITDSFHISGSEKSVGNGTDPGGTFTLMQPVIQERPRSWFPPLASQMEVG